MKRRTFIWLSAVSAASLYIPAVGCKEASKPVVKALAQPQFLAQFCDEATIREIGNAYKKIRPNEQKATNLERLLLTDTTGRVAANTNDTTNLQTLLQQKITHDFETGQTVIVKGWVLSQTEARQCALYTLQA